MPGATTGDANAAPLWEKYPFPVGHHEENYHRRDALDTGVYPYPLDLDPESKELLQCWSI